MQENVTFVTTARNVISTPHKYKLLSINYERYLCQKFFVKQGVLSVFNTFVFITFALTFTYSSLEMLPYVQVD